MVVDIHTHRDLPQPEGVFSTSPRDFLRIAPQYPGQRWSVGYHPWHMPQEGLTEKDMGLLREAASRPEVVAIGECGVDLLHEGAAPMFRQLPAFREQARLAAELRKPLVIHCVKAWDVVISLRKEIKREFPDMPQWIIHGFRGKPSVARMLLDQGIGLSYGERFNPDSLRVTPAPLLFAETDESRLDIGEIVARLSEADGRVPEALKTNPTLRALNI